MSHLPVHWLVHVYSFAMYSLFYYYLPVFVDDLDADETVVASSLRDETVRHGIIPSRLAMVVPRVVS